MEVLKVSSKSNPNSVAGALAGIVREQGAAEIQTVGAGALNQAIKAIAIARGFIAPSGLSSPASPPSRTSRSTARSAPRSACWSSRGTCTANASARLRRRAADLHVHSHRLRRHLRARAISVAHAWRGLESWHRRPRLRLRLAEALDAASELGLSPHPRGELSGRGGSRRPRARLLRRPHRPGFCEHLGPAPGREEPASAADGRRASRAPATTCPSTTSCGSPTAAQWDAPMLHARCRTRATSTRSADAFERLIGRDRPFYVPKDVSRLRSGRHDP